jgi:hypothetical protein
VRIGSEACHERAILVLPQHQHHQGPGTASSRGDNAHGRGSIGYTGSLSLELFNDSYWKLPAIEVARTDLEKMKQLVQQAF